MPRRGECIYKRKDGRWEGRYIAKYDLNGKAKYASVYSKSYLDVKHRLIEKKQMIQINEKNTNITFEKILYMWLDNRQLKLKLQTYSKYKRLIETHIIPVIGTINIEKVNSTLINKFLFEKSESGNLKSNTGLSPSYVKTMSFILTSSLQFAEKEGFCIHYRNDIVRLSKIQKSFDVLTVHEQKLLESYIEKSKNHIGIGIMLSLYAGLRIGEVCGLKWEDVDLSAKTIHIHRTVCRLNMNDSEKNKPKTMLMLGDAKTLSSDRIIPIPEKLIPIFLQLRTNYTEFVISGKTYPYMDPRTIQYAFKKCLIDCGVRTINYHTLRHTFATRCIESGMDIKSLSEILGHASVNITLNTYVHSSMDHKRKQIDEMIAYCGQ